MRPTIPLRKSLACRLALYLLLFSLLATGVEVAFNQSQRFERYLSEKENQLAQIRDTNLKSLGNSLWKVDDQALKLQLEGLRQLPDVALVQVLGQDGELLAGTGADLDIHRLERVFPLENEFRGKQTELGSLRVVLGLDAAYETLRRDTLSVVLVQLGRTLLLAGALLVIFYAMVARHLRRMAEYASALTVHQLGEPLRLDRRMPVEDELAQLAGSLEAMRVNLDTSVRGLCTANDALREEVALRQAAEGQLRATRGFLQNIVDSMPSVILGLSGQMLLTHCNAAASRLTGLCASQALGRPLEEVLPPLAPYAGLVAQAVRDRRPVLLQRLRLEFPGEALVMDMGVFPLTLDAAGGVVLRLDDASERVRMEEVLVQTEKMASLGGLAAGMAHEINNPLAGVLQNEQSLRRRLACGFEPNEQAAREAGLELAALERYLALREVPGLLDGVRSSGERAARIVANMLSFARRSPARHTPQNLAALLDASVELAASDWDLAKKFDFKRIRISTEVDPALPPVPCAAQEIEQVILNMLKNAAQAMSSADSEDPQIQIAARRQGGWAVISLTDNGPGMEEAVRKRVFDPFFTTKEQGQGTGLGLSVSYFIVSQNHGGTIEVYSAPGRGTSFRVRLPLPQSDGADPAG